MADKHEQRERLSFSISPTAQNLNIQQGQALKIPLNTRLKRTSSSSTSEVTSTKSRRSSRGSDDDTSGGAGVNSIGYRGIRASAAAASGNLPVCVLLWSMAATKRPPVNLMTPDAQGNNLVHYAALADSPEILGFL